MAKVENLNDFKRQLNSKKKEDALTFIMDFMEFDSEEERKEMFRRVTTLSDHEWMLIDVALADARPQTERLLESASDVLSVFMAGQVETENTLSPELLMIAMVDYYLTLTEEIGLEPDPYVSRETLFNTCVSREALGALKEILEHAETGRSNKTD